MNLAVELPPRPVVVDGDPTRLAQACDNLISNALKFTGRAGSVTVSLTETDFEAVISVQDTGMGIPAAEIDSLFTRLGVASVENEGTTFTIALPRTLVASREIVVIEEDEESVV